MKKRMKSVLITFMLLATLLFVTACAEELGPYEENDSLGYSVSVKFDANGGDFATATYSIIDSYNISGLKTNSMGNVELALIAPDDSVRGEGNSFTAQNPGHFLVGWATKDENGNIAKMFDLEKDRVEVDPDKTYTAAEPVLTLYAVWAPEFEINFYSLSDGSLLKNYKFNPNKVTELEVPHWDDSGAMKNYEFPAVDGHTFVAAYLDSGATQPVEGKLTHSGVINYENGTVENGVMDVYVQYREGNWFRIDSVDDFRKNASPVGSYELLTDLDFEGAIWPTALMYGNFTGTIVGNKEDGTDAVISNVTITQNDNSRINTGLFGVLGEGALLQGVDFNNITLEIKGGSRMTNGAFGLLAGTISDKAHIAEGVDVLSGKVIIDVDAYFNKNGDFVFGKFCGDGWKDTMDYSMITVELTGENAADYLIKADTGNAIEYGKVVDNPTETPETPETPEETPEQTPDTPEENPA